MSPDRIEPWLPLILRAFLVALAAFPMGLLSAPSSEDGPTKWSLLQISMYPPVQLADEDHSIIGLRFNLFLGRNPEVYGLDTGLVNFSDTRSGGIALGAWNDTGDHYGVQIALANRAHVLWGLQFGLFNDSTDATSGAQFGAVNRTREAFLPMTGLFYNQSSGPSSMGQFTLGINNGGAPHVPVQIAGLGNSGRNEVFLQTAGIINMSKSSGLQFSGVANVSMDKDQTTYLQIAGLSNHAKLGLVQFAGIGNSGIRIPWQTSGLVNYSEDSWWQLTAGVNISSQSTVQLAGLGNVAHDSAIQLSALYNQGSSSPFQLALIVNRTGNSLSQIALYNQSAIASMQLGAVNVADDNEGMQLGLYNRSVTTDTLQFGLVNDTSELDGLQIGLLNIGRKSSLPVTIILRASFDSNKEAPTGFVSANWTPLQLALYSPGQLYTADSPVRGLALNVLFGTADSVAGFNVGLASRADQVLGLSGGVANISQEFAGLNLGVVSIQSEIMAGISISGLLTYSGEMHGIAIAPVAISEGDANGLQMGLWNSAKKTSLPQFGGVNLSTESPAQFGLFNYNTDGSHAQVGMMNVNYGEGWFQIGGLGNHSRDAMYGFQLAGLYNSSEFSLLQISGISNSCGQSCPIQIAGLANRNSYHSGPRHYGLNVLQAALIWNRGHKATIQVGLGNRSEEAMLQAGFLNISGTSDIQVGFFNGTGGGGFLRFGIVNGALGRTDHALWIGAINYAGSTEGMTLGVWNVGTAYNSGLMIGMFNYAGKNDGIQIGVINVDGASLLPILPVIRF